MGNAGKVFQRVVSAATGLRSEDESTQIIFISSLNHPIKKREANRKQVFSGCYTYVQNVCHGTRNSNNVSELPLYS